ncbi:prolyl oligopeptidase family serine peptidase [Aquipuribacter nitratireducens]|uniref:Prolyl oligopeptidase family serine peptidase n=1 Tax=Aquipuribacter nitratireducens TaxID=650104 RepID=A0ABW0GNS6_9MICO
MTDLTTDTSDIPDTAREADAATSPFADLDAYQALPRLGGLALSPDGTRLVTGLQTLNPEANRFVTALWEVDPSGRRPARRLTRSAKGESLATFTPDGTLLFTSARPDPDAPGDDDGPAALWALPPGPGEARVVAARPGGIGVACVARDSGDVVVTSATLPGADDTAASDEERRKARKDGKVTAILHEAFPVRYWDGDLGPDAPRLLVGRLGDDDDADLELRQVVGHVRHGLRHAVVDVTADGRTAVTTWDTIEGRAVSRFSLVSIDLATGARRTLLSDPDLEFEQPRISPDGSTVALQVYRRSTPDDPGDYRLAVAPLGRPGEVDNGSEHVTYREVAPGWDRWSGRPVWTPDGRALLVTADSDGRAPVFRVDVASGAVTQLTGDDAAYSDVVVSADGRHVYALRSAVGAPPAPVRLDPETPHQTPVHLRGPVPAPVVPGRLEEVTATGEDGTPLRAWLCLPDGADEERPAPLLLWIHGGPLGSWNAWSWRWNPWLAVARGYAVLLPDPALSTGYGIEFIRRGWGAWGDAPYSDLLALTDAAEARGDVDETRTAAMGGSFGGYMANWVGGHTDRFRAIVTHASLYALDQFAATTDAAHYWEREMSPEMTAHHSPHHHVDRWVTPTLVVHGDKDYRVPIGEALRLWWDLASKDTDEHGVMPHKFLYFPDENHWILTPNHSTLWYETVFAFLAHHVLGQEWRTPELLR